MSLSSVGRVTRTCVYVDLNDSVSEFIRVYKSRSFGFVFYCESSTVVGKGFAVFSMARIHKIG